MHNLNPGIRCLFVLIALFFRPGQPHAQVLVHEEPRHPPVFQNDKIRILNALLPPGDTTQYHVHHTPSLFIFFTSTTTGSQLQGAAASTGRSTAGTLLFENLAPPRLRVHRVWNMDTATFHVMDVELLSKDSGFTVKPLSLPHLKLVIDTPWIRAYQIILEAGNDCTLRDTKRSLVMVSLDAAPVQIRQGKKAQLQTLEPGSFFVIKAGQAFAVKNTGSAAVRLALLEVPER